MKNVIAAKVFLGTLSVLIILACGLIPPGRIESQANPNEPGATEVGGTAGGGCTNPYYPVVLNASWTYKSTGSSRGEHTFTEAISAVRVDGFTVITDYGTATKSLDWACTPQGLLVFGAGKDQAESLSVDVGQTGLAMTTKNALGTTLPVKINPGDRWTQAYEYESTGDLGGMTIASSGTVSSTYESMGEESITTPAGTFQAIKIVSETKENVTIGGSPTISTNEYQEIFWFVEGIGRVRSESTGSHSETIELQSFNIP